MTRITLNAKQRKREAHLDLVLKDLQKAEVVRCLGHRITSIALRHPDSAPPLVECLHCPHSHLCQAVREVVSKL